MAHEEGVVFPETTILAGRLAQRLRYGENPHQAAAFYRSGDGRPGVATARQLQGKELSYNNYGDADAAFELVGEFAGPDGVLPADFDGLVRDAFGDVLHTVGA